MLMKVFLGLGTVLLATVILATPALAQTDGGTDATDAAATDATAADATPTDATTDADAFAPPCGDTLGRTCTEAGGECGDNGICLLVTQAYGICTCNCTPDDPATPDNEDDCPATDSTCGVVQLTSGYYAFCFMNCQPHYGGNDCNAGFSCNPQTVYFSNKWNQAVCLLPGCSSDDDCLISTGQSCDTGMTGQCGTDESCATLVEGSTLGVCAKAGLCDVTSGLCDKHPTKNPSAAVGDPCVADTDCGEYMDCQLELDEAAHGKKGPGQPCLNDEDCCGTCDPLSGCQGECSVSARNGYCMLSGCAVATSTDFAEHACPAGSTCSRLYYGGVCLKTCDPADATTCRDNPNDFYGDYECRSWNNVEMETGVNYTDEPVCEFGGMISCAAGLDCEELAPANNPQDMACRTLDGTKTTDPADPAGTCMDNTSSGPMPPPPPDAGYQDTGVDAGVDAEPDATTVDTAVVDTAADTDEPEQDVSVEEDSAQQEDSATTVDAAETDDASVKPKDDDGGCSCQVGTSPQPWLLIGLLALVFRRRRRG